MAVSVPASVAAVDLAVDLTPAIPRRQLWLRALERHRSGGRCGCSSRPPRGRRFSHVFRRGATFSYWPVSDIVNAIRYFSFSPATALACARCPVRR
jgi:hypothetical protein